MKTVFGVIGSLALIIGLLYCSVALSAFDLSFYEAEYDKYNVSDIIKIDRKELMSVTVHMLDYLEGKQENLQTEAFVNNRQREFFSQRELDHMIDVKKLFEIGRTLKNVCFCLFAVAFVYLSATLQPDTMLLRSKKIKPGFIAKTYLWTLAVFTIALAVLCFWAYHDFDLVFTIFHKTFFTNDLWLLDPETDLLINIVPLGFFMDIARRIAVVFVGFLGVTALLCVAALRFETARRVPPSALRSGNGR